MKGDRERSRNAGCDDDITKPIDPKHFTAQLRQFLQQIRLEKR